MSILLSTIFPLALSGALSNALAEVGIPALAAQARSAPITAAAPVALAKPVRVKVAPSAKSSKPSAVTPAVVAPQAPLVQLVQVQGPSPSPAPPAAAPVLDKSAIIDRVSKALSDVRTAQGKFTQVDARGVTSTGAFFISRPGKIRFDYDKPELMHIVSDGVSVSIEEPKRKSYDQVPLASTQLHLFLRSSVDLKRDGSATYASSSNGSHFVTLVDKTGEAEGKMILEFSAVDFELLGWRALDGAGAETKVRLFETKKNLPLKASLFIVKDPEDAEHR